MTLLLEWARPLTKLASLGFLDWDAAAEGWDPRNPDDLDKKSTSSLSRFLSASSAYLT